MSGRIGRRGIAWGILCLAVPLAAAGDEWRWRRPFDGKVLDGWNVAGGAWKVEDGAIVGAPSPDGAGGSCRAKESDGDCEIYLDVKLDPGADAALLLRAADGGKGYEIALDGRDGGRVGAVSAVGRDKPVLVEIPKEAGALRPNDWNRLYVRIDGKAPHIVAILNARKIADVTDTQEGPPAEGPLGFRIGAGKAGAEGTFARFRDIRVRPVGSDPPLTGDVPDNDAEVARIAAKVFFIVDRAGQALPPAESPEAKVGYRIRLDCTPKDAQRKHTRAKGRPTWTFNDPSLIQVSGESPYNPVLVVLKPGMLTLFVEIDGMRSKDVPVKLVE